MSLLRLCHFDVLRGNKRVVSDVGFALGKGESLCVMGHNGSGKTSLLRALLGLLPLERGEVFLHQKPVAPGAMALRRKVGVVFQEYSHDAKLTVRENLLLGARLFHIAKQKALETLRRLAVVLELEDLMARRCEQLSGGQRRRVELARALIHEPELLVLDEPTVGLDPAARVAFLRLIEERQKEGLSVLMTTHDAQEAARQTRVMMLADGIEIACDTPEALLARCPEDVILLESDASDALFDAISACIAKADGSAKPAAMRVATGVEVRVASGHMWVPKLVDAAQGLGLGAVHLRRASLAEVMMRLTSERSLKRNEAL